MNISRKNIKYKAKVGIMGGTFDPIHYGHLVAADRALECFSLEKVIFIPAGSPPHKHKNNVLEGKHRYNMVSLAIKDHPGFGISSIEMDKEGPSYTIDTIKELKVYYQKRNTQIFFITGADSILTIEEWKCYKELLEKTYFIGVTREGYGEEEFYKKIRDLDELYGERIFPMEIPAIGISSTDLRKRVLKNKSIKYLLPPLVEEYIKKHKLYK